MLAVITVLSGRHTHLQNQLRGLRAGTRRPDCHVIVGIDDPAITDLVDGEGCVVISQARVEDRLPVAAARNRGAERALAAGADTLVFLDVDCIPGPDLAQRYETAVALHPRALLSGPVAYLPPPRADGGYALGRLPELGRVHPARPMPPEDGVEPLAYELFWSLSFALAASTWIEIGGFCESYTGYGAEDTDLGQLARTRGIAHYAVGGARAYHQWHPAPQPPLQHLNDIVRNAGIFHTRWGWWPMSGWLEAFRHLGLATFDVTSERWIVSRENE